MGGDSAKDQMRLLSDGVDIVCGTPGRLDDLINTGKLDLSGVRNHLTMHICSRKEILFSFSNYRFNSLYWMRQ